MTMLAMRKPYRVSGSAPSDLFYLHPTFILLGLDTSISSATMSSSYFQQIMDDALDEYLEKTGIDLRSIQSPFADKLKDCKSPDAILALLQEKEKDFNKFRDKYRKVIDSLKPIAQLLHTLSDTLGEALSLVSLSG